TTSEVDAGGGVCGVAGAIGGPGAAVSDGGARLPDPGDHAGHDVAGRGTVSTGGVGGGLREAMASGGGFEAFKTDDEDGYLTMRDGGGDSEGTDDVCAGVQPGADGDGEGGESPGCGGGTDQLRRCAALAVGGGSGCGAATSEGEPRPEWPM